MKTQADSALGDEEDNNSDDQADSETSTEENLLTGEQLADAALQDPVAKKKLRKEFQRVDDRASTRAEKKADKALFTAEQIAAKLGITDPAQIEQAQKDLALEIIVNERFGSEKSDEVPGAGPDDIGGELMGQDAVDQANRLFSAGVEPELKTAVLKLVAGKKFANTIELGRFVMDETYRLSTKPEPDDASRTQRQGDASIGDETDDDKQKGLRAQYEKELETTHPGNVKVVNLKYRELGLRI